MFTPHVLIAVESTCASTPFAEHFTATGWTSEFTHHAAPLCGLVELHRPELVLIDVQLGPRGGLDALRRLKASPLTANTPVVMFCEGVTTEVNLTYLAAGAMAVIERPLRKASLEALQRLVRGRSRAPRVLISDDDPQMVRLLEKSARLEGLDPVSDLDASHIVELAKSVRPQAIVLDLRQRQVDGRDVLRGLKSCPQTHAIRVVMLSGVDSQAVRDDCLELGADDYFVKPFDPQFFPRIARHIAGEKLEAERVSHDRFRAAAGS